MKTFSAKPSDITRKWYIIDASEAPLGRVATVAANLLIGKSKPTYTPHMDGGDHVIVINSNNLVVTGKKTNQKIYYRHSHYPGGLKQAKLSDKQERDETAVITHAIRGMLPINKLRDGRLARLKVYGNEQHRHDPQKPIKISIKEVKNA